MVKKKLISQIPPKEKCRGRYKYDRFKMSTARKVNKKKAVDEYDGGCD